MSIITDAEYLIYRMRISLLLPISVDSLTERIITLPTESDNDYILAEQPTHIAKAFNNNKNNETNNKNNNNNNSPRIQTTTTPPHIIVRKADRSRHINHLMMGKINNSTININNNNTQPLFEQHRPPVSGVVIDTANGKRSPMSPAAATTAEMKSLNESSEYPDTIKSESTIVNHSTTTAPRVFRIGETRTLQAEAKKLAQLRELKENLAEEELKVEALKIEIANLVREEQPSPVPQIPEDDGQIQRHEKSVSEKSSLIATGDGNEVFLSPPPEASQNTSEDQSSTIDNISQKLPLGGALDVSASALRERTYSYISKASIDSDDEFAAVDDEAIPEGIYMLDEPEVVSKEGVVITNGEEGVPLDVAPTTEDYESRDTINPAYSPTKIAAEPASTRNGELTNHAITQVSQDAQKRELTDIAETSANSSHNQLLEHNSFKSKSSQGNVFAKRELPRSDNKASTSQLLDSLNNLIRPVSTLTTLINERANTNNPFADEYAAFSGNSDSDSVKIKIYIPFREHHPKPLIIKVKRETTVEEVIGYILYEYINQSITPTLPEKLCDIVMWCLRIAEDDGIIDDDFPALERSRKIHKFAFDQFALCEATAEQAAAEKARRATAIKSQAINDPTSATPASAASNPTASQILYIRVHLYSTIEVKQTTTLQLPGTTLLSEVFEQVCKKRKYEPKDYVLKMVDTKTDVPVDKSLADLKTTEFCILKRDRGGAGDIFLRPPDEETKGDNQPQFMISDEYTSMYKVSIEVISWYTDTKLYLKPHVLAAENRKLFDSAKTNSHNISTVVSCKLNKKQSTHFKLIVKRVDRDHKTYDLEALTANEAGWFSSKFSSYAFKSYEQPIAEICARITFMAKISAKDLTGALSVSSLNLLK